MQINLPNAFADKKQHTSFFNDDYTPNLIKTCMSLVIEQSVKPTAKVKPDGDMLADGIVDLPHEADYSPTQY